MHQGVVHCCCPLICPCIVPAARSPTRSLPLPRTCAQALGILAEVEGASFGRRVPALLPQLADVLASRAEQDAAAAEAAAMAEPGEAEDLLAAAPGWQEAYYSLLLLQRVLEATAVQLAWAAGPAVQRCWGGAQRLLLHRHQWVRKASGRLVGAGLAAPAVGPPMLEASGAGAAGASLRLLVLYCSCMLPRAPALVCSTCLHLRLSAVMSAVHPAHQSLCHSLCRRAGPVLLPPTGLSHSLPFLFPTKSPPHFPPNLLCRRAGPVLLPPAGLGGCR